MAPTAPSPDAIELSHPDKVLFPDAGVTKADLAAYYEAVAPVLLPHVHGRPLSLQVFPRGIGGPGHFMKNVPDYFPGWVRRVTVPKKGGTVTHVLAENPATLVLLANHNAITPHVWTSRADRLDRPDRLIIDLDPSGADEFPTVRAGGRIVAETMREAGLEPFAMLTGSRGLHVVAPLRRDLDFDGALELARAIAARTVEAAPEQFTTEFLKKERDGRIFVDILRNRWAQTAVAPYGVRARPGAPVAVPVSWEELEDDALHSASFTVADVPARVAAQGDPWADIAEHAASPKAALRRLHKSV